MLQKLIRTSEKQCWSKVIADLQEDIWEQGYGIVKTGLQIRVPKLIWVGMINLSMSKSRNGI